MRLRWSFARRCGYDGHMRFTVRDLLWLMIVVGVSTALWLERRASPPVRFTGQPFDVEIAGEGFIQLVDPVTCGSLYTRFGNFTISDSERLVLETDGTQYEVNPGMCIPLGATAVSISPTGLVSLKYPPKAEMFAVGQLQLARFPRPDKLQKVAYGIYVSTPASGQASIYNPGQPQVGTIIQGALTK